MIHSVKRLTSAYFSHLIVLSTGLFLLGEQSVYAGGCSVLEHRDCELNLFHPTEESYERDFKEQHKDQPKSIKWVQKYSLLNLHSPVELKEALKEKGYKVLERPYRDNDDLQQKISSLKEGTLYFQFAPTLRVKKSGLMNTVSLSLDYKQDQTYNDDDPQTIMLGADRVMVHFFGFKNQVDLKWQTIGKFKPRSIPYRDHISTLAKCTLIKE